MLCWLCSLSYKRALVRTKQSDPARHSRVFKAEKDKERKEKKAASQQPKDKYFNHKKPQRPDVTKMKVPFPDAIDSSDSHHHRSGGGGSDRSGRDGSGSMPKMPKFHHKDRRKDRGDNDTDHLAEITQLKEKIAALGKTINTKTNQLIAKQAEMTQMKAKLFNDENVIKEKMRKMAKVFFFS